MTDENQDKKKTRSEWAEEVIENLRYEPEYKFEWEKNVESLPFEFKDPHPDLERMRALRWNPPYPISPGEERLLELNQKPQRVYYGEDYRHSVEKAVADEPEDTPEV